MKKILVTGSNGQLGRALHNCCKTAMLMSHIQHQKT